MAQAREAMKREGLDPDLPPDRFREAFGSGLTRFRRRARRLAGRMAANLGSREEARQVLERERFAPLADAVRQEIERKEELPEPPAAHSEAVTLPL